ncbi:MAG TPA: hypothetical protein VL285_02030, partial [Bryobacteraceae bacterium]|nr:hypothetical protein [Bryobacteraceae bacterium]
MNVYIGTGPCSVATTTTQLAANQSYTGTINLQGGNQFGTINVNLAVGNTGGSVNGVAAFPSSVTFNATQGGAVNSQNVQITFNGNPQQITTASFTPISGPGFLNTPTFSFSTANLSVSTTNLAPGTYTGTVSLGTAFGAVNVPVTLTIAGGGTGGLVASPGAVSFFASPFGQVNPQAVQVTLNGTPQNITGFTFTPNAGGVSFLNTSINGSLATLSVNNTSLGNGVYTGTETLFTANGSVPVQVTLNIGSGAANITVTPNPVNFTIQPGGSAPSQNVFLTVNGAPVNTPNPATVTTSTGETWLQATVAAAPGTVVVSVSGSLLSPGTYTGTVTLLTDQGTVSFQVNLTVGSGGVSGVVANPNSVAFNAVPGGQAGSQNVSVTVNGVPTTITNFSFTPASGGVSFLNTALNGSVATLSVNNTNLSNGVYTGTETLFTPNGSVSVQVTLTIGGGAGGSNITANPNPVTFNIQPGGSAQAQSVSIQANGVSANVTNVSATTTTGQPWLVPTVSFSPGVVTVSVNGAFLAAGSYSGTVTVNTIQGTGTFQVNLNVGGVTGNLNPGGSMAHLAAGGFWKTIITLVNTGATASQARLNFFDDNGSALPLALTFPQVSPSAQSPVTTLDRTLNPGATLTVEATGPDFQPVKTGWVQLLSSGGISGFAVFRQSIGSGQQEAVVPLENRSAGTYVLSFDNTSGFVTGVALANTTAQVVFITVNVRDDNGTVIQATSLSLPPLGHTSFNLTDR